jgi:crotonobetainyl-CoA:carnitine CoA-transferase CaiB-like acyl-CoA transferase
MRLALKLHPDSRCDAVSNITVDVVRTRPQRDWLAALDAAQVPCGPINKLDAVFADPQVIARGMRLDIDDGRGNALPSVRAPMLMSKTPLAYKRPSPRLGEHTAEILAELEKPGE